jgi:prepilin peptidase CpaA
MIALIVLLVLLVVAAWTDFRSHRIYNVTTYPGMLLAVALNAAGLGMTSAGLDGVAESGVGFLACGLIMLFAFVLFDVGGGDVKLLAMIGCFLGLEDGIESLLWTFSLGFVAGISAVIWQHGVWNLLRGTAQHVWLVVKSRGWVPLTQTERKPLEHGLFLAPAALVAVAIVEWPLIESWLPVAPAQWLELF